MLTKIDHIGIVVYSLEKGIDYYENVLGISCEAIEDNESQKIKTASFKIGNINLELLCPVSKESPMFDYLEKHGEGVHHLAFESNNIEGDLKSVCEKGIKLIDQKVINSKNGESVAFLNPETTHKVLTEFCSKNKDSYFEIVRQQA